MLVFGGSGQLGTALIHELTASGREVRAPARDAVDLEQGGVDEAIGSAAAVINAAAFNDVDGAELPSNRSRVDRLNRDAPAEMARVCAVRGIPFVHVSTDYVFDGRCDRPYREDDPARPQQSYGRSKREGELAVLAACPQAVVARTSTLYGRGTRGGSNYVEAVIRQARTAGRLEVVELPRSSPTSAADLARGLLALIEHRARGIVHVTNSGGCSRLELAKAALRYAGLGERVRVRTRPASPSGAARPRYSVLDVSRFAEITGQAMRPWQEALAEFLEGESPTA